MPLTGGKDQYALWKNYEPEKEKKEGGKKRESRIRDSKRWRERQRNHGEEKGKVATNLLRKRKRVGKRGRQNRMWDRKEREVGLEMIKRKRVGDVCKEEKEQ